MVRLFGTDGVRGVAGEALTGQLAIDVARAAASVLHDAGAFAAAEESGRRPLAVVGRDPRASGEVLEAAAVAGLTAVVDGAHGAAAAFAAQLLRRAGAEVIATGGEPDGHNINAGCGSTHLEILSAEVTKRGADAGIAHDGDADRCLAVGADGEVIDGDQILAVLALALASRGELPGNTVVTTVMSNLGFRNAMQDAGITVVETAVGDRYVLEAMRDGHFGLGGEQSGHIIML